MCGSLGNKHKRVPLDQTSHIIPPRFCSKTSYYVIPKLRSWRTDILDRIAMATWKLPWLPSKESYSPYC